MTVRREVTQKLFVARKKIKLVNSVNVKIEKSYSHRVTDDRIGPLKLFLIMSLN